MNNTKMVNMKNVDFVELFDSAGMTIKEFTTFCQLDEAMVIGKLKRGRREIESKKSKPVLEDSEEVASYDESENEKVLSSYGTRITTLQQLVEACKINLDEWVIERHVINKWEVGARKKTKSLVFEKGSMSGSIEDDGTITVEPLFQVKAWLIRKTPVEITPFVKPVSFSVISKVKVVSTKESKSVLVLPDPQIGFRRDMYSGELIPYHSRLALNVALQISQHVRPDYIIWLGDLMDLAEWSDKFVRTPDFYFTTQPAIIEAAWWMAKFGDTQSGNGEHILLEGNHDMRIKTAISNNMAYAFGLRSADEIRAKPVLDLRTLLSLDNLGVKYVDGYPNNEYSPIFSLKFIHGILINPKAMLERVNVTTIHGHTHRVEWQSKTIRSGNKTDVVSIMSPGCLCKIDGTVPGSDNINQWQQGIGIVRYNEYGDVSISPVGISNGVAMYREYRFTGYDQTGLLAKETGYKF
jgi:hypothetical protein